MIDEDDPADSMRDDVKRLEESSMTSTKFSSGPRRTGADAELVNEKMPRGRRAAGIRVDAHRARPEVGAELSPRAPTAPAGGRGTATTKASPITFTERPHTCSPVKLMPTMMGSTTRRAVHDVERRVGTSMVGRLARRDLERVLVGHPSPCPRCSWIPSPK